MKNFETIITISLYILITICLAYVWNTWNTAQNKEIEKIQQMQDEAGAQFTHDYYINK